MPTAASLNEKWEAWKKLGVLASEMEASTLFVVGSALGLRCGAVFHVVWNQERAALGLDTDAEEDHDTDKAIRTAIRALEIMIEQQ
jgi:uridine phosphorylase